MSRYGQFNPYFPNGYNPYQPPMDPRLQQLRQPMPVMPQMPGQPLKTPEQYKEEISKQMGEQLNQYNNYYQQATSQQKMQTNSGSYVKVDSYDEVKNIQAPADGKPVIIIDQTNGRLYSKRFDNGQEYIKGFSLNPLENAENKGTEALKDEASATTPVEDKNALEAILNRINDRLDKLEGGNKDVNAGNAVKPAEV